MRDSNYWIGKLQLEAHPEGGYFRETYRSKSLINEDLDANIFPNQRSYATAIYYLLEQGQFSAFHKIKSDELWHFYDGASLNIHVIYPDKTYQILNLGNEISTNQELQVVVPAGAWFASESTGSYSLVGCTVSPGFDFKDFELADGKKLTQDFPEYNSIIQRLTR